MKPLNPILGETYEFVDNRLKFRYFAEQVRHHPPISAYVVESQHFKIVGDTTCKSSFSVWKGALEVEFSTNDQIEFKEKDYFFTLGKPKMFLKGLVFGTPHFDFSGKITIRDENNNFPFTTEVKFYSEGAKVPGVGYFRAKVKKGEQVIAFALGDWRKGMFLLETKVKKEFNKVVLDELFYNFENEIKKHNFKISLIWENEQESFMKQFDPNDYLLSKYACCLNELTNNLRKVLPPTDSRFRPDNRLYEEGEKDKAQEEKNRIEQLQRERNKILNNQKKVYKPIYFDEVGNNFVYLGDYWGQREKGEWKEHTDIFNQV